MVKCHLHWSLLPVYHEIHIAPHIHPALNRGSLLNYLFEIHIYPAKRLDYLGNEIVLPISVVDEDCVGTIQTRDHKTDLAAIH